MPDLTGELEATGRSGVFRAKRRFNVQLTGTFEATVKLQRSFDGGTTWTTLSQSLAGTECSYTAPMSYMIDEPELCLYSFNCTAYTSGTIEYRFGD